MARTNHPALPGATDLFSLLAVIQDPKIVKDFFDAYHKESKRLDERIAKVGLAKEIERLHSAAGQDRALAFKELAEAREKANTSTERAKVKAQKIEDDTSSWAAEMQETLEDKAQALKSKESGLAIVEADLSKREKRVGSDLAKAERLDASAKRMKADYEAKLSVIQGAARAVA
jgi:F0F1-type ATP synthase membrane subunit b/b'